jgi:hypothetical protein
MFLIRLSGHSGAGKSRLLAALARNRLSFRRAVIYTSRAPRPGEIHGKDYYFMSRGFIEGLSAERFLIGNVRNVLQAIDIAQLEFDLRAGFPVIAEVFHTRWPPLKERLLQILGEKLVTRSVFLTAVPLNGITNLSPEDASLEIQARIEKILSWRGKDAAADIRKRAESAVKEVMEALTVPSLYDRVFDSSPEGPDGEDDWTSGSVPRGNAAKVLREFTLFFEKLWETDFPESEV